MPRTGTPDPLLSSSPQRPKRRQCSDSGKIHRWLMLCGRAALSVSSLAVDKLVDPANQVWAADAGVTRNNFDADAGHDVRRVADRRRFLCERCGCSNPGNSCRGSSARRGSALALLAAPAHRGHRIPGATAPAALLRLACGIARARPAAPRGGSRRRRFHPRIPRIGPALSTRPRR